ncbi:MAG TPA: hypothetical protein PKA28_00235 [Methylomusa anaerophila]|uniref:Uncharacterized protein n=2 Tax=Methylomusa anaerophila TaxID=1930071 RepID=A0A348AQG3_9FIRM|nr:hypothetical protein [Methylomusa anaerophila]BBB93311.1 hypothetical protein MAMMFC1_04023 [Methylomusa anaerophila]HML86858.1 hypothetical protein [Methylomusa anaerophila]
MERSLLGKRVPVFISTLLLLIISVAFLKITFSAEMLQANAVSKKQAPTVELQTQPVMPKGYRPDMSLRDPFALAANFKGDTGDTDKPVPVASTPNNSGATDVTTKAEQVFAKKLPILVGVISQGDSKAAILKFEGVSRSYQLQDRIGAFQVVEIRDATVMLSGRGGTYEITFER